MKRLVVVSNRVGPIKGAARAGGLAVALVDALRKSGGLWFGWSGDISDPSGGVRTESAGTFSTATLNLSEAEHRDYYQGFANRCLWPLFHFRIDLTAYDRVYYEGYQRVNRRFAHSLQPLLRDNDLVWIHDYHLIPFGQELRAMGVQQRLGFFLHIPFPSREVIVTLPHHQQLAQSLFAYDLLGFQTARDCERFIDYVLGEVPDARLDGEHLTAYGRRVCVRSFPIGIETEQYSGLHSSEDGRRQFQRATTALRGRTQVIGVDRLDYTKGIPERIDAFERLLTDYPDTHRRVEFLQVAPLSRETVPEYEVIRRQLEQQSGRINGRYADVDWTPMRYLNRTLSRRSLAGLYRASKIGLVTPLRDGMNLVAKEYVAAQDPADPGVLVLSRFAGSAVQMKAALLVNPYDTVAVAEAMQTARYMSLEERLQRHGELMKGLLEYDIARWSEEFLAALREC